MAITRQEAVDMSILKWETVANGGETYLHACGFCLYMEELGGDDSVNGLCKNCPLFPEICANIYYDENDNDLQPQPLFWQHRYSKSDTTIAQQILDAIKTRGQAWIEEE